MTRGPAARGGGRDHDVGHAVACDVVHVTQALKAGLRRYIVDLALELQARGVAQALIHSPLVTDPATAPALAALRAHGIATIELPMVRELAPAQDAISAARLRRVLRRLRPRVLHLHSSKAGGIGRLAAAASPALSMGVVYTPNASAANLGRRYVAAERLLGWLRTDRIVAVSASEHAELARLGVVAPGKLVRVDTGVCIDEIRARAAGPLPAGLPAGRRLIVAAGRLTAQKNPELLVAASRLVAAAHGDAHFVWAGDGELRESTERELAAAGIGDRWTFVGALENPYPLLAAAEVVVLPSRYEGLPLVLLEAMALGRPIVATDVTGSRDAVAPGHTGELVPPGDAGALAAAIGRILADEALAARYGAAAMRRADERHTRARMGAEMLEVYRAAAPGFRRAGAAAD